MITPPWPVKNAPTTRRAWFRSRRGRRKQLDWAARRPQLLFFIKAHTDHWYRHKRESEEEVQQVSCAAKRVIIMNHRLPLYNGAGTNLIHTKPTAAEGDEPQKREIGPDIRVSSNRFLQSYLSSSFWRGSRRTGPDTACAIRKVYTDWSYSDNWCSLAVSTKPVADGQLFGQ
jgi:hypothetical protein